MIRLSENGDMPQVSEAPHIPVRFNPRQKILLRLVAFGYCDKEIAAELNVSQAAATRAVGILRRKLGSASRFTFPAIAMLLGIVTVEELIERARKILNAG
jgi:DNA-binding NarL/FixJ family response regulator